MDLQEARAAVERACEQFQHPATQAQAEQVLLQFRRSPGVLPACRHILEQSGSAEARFHAACALREGVLREWASLPAEERTGLRSYVLQYVLHHAAEPQLQVVRSILQGTLAVMTKRGWMDADAQARAAFFQELSSSSQAVGSAPAQVVALQVMEAAVSEFSLVTASPIGLSWEYHESCRNAFEEQFLQQIFKHALHCARQFGSEAASAAPGSEAAAASGAAAAAAMKLMTSVLAWDWKASNSSLGFMSATLAGLTSAMATRKGLSDTTQVKPGSQWAELLLVPDTTDWLLSLNPSLTAPAAASSPLAQASRQLVVAFCSLAGDIFPKPPAAPTAGAPAPVPAAPVQVAYVTQMLRLVLPWVLPAQQVLQQALAGDEGQLVDACRALSALCAGHKPGVLEAASAAVQQQQPQAPSIFTALEELSRSFLAAGGVSATSSPEPWLYECTEMLLECWSGLLAPQCGYNMVTVPPPHQAVESAGRTAAALVEAALADAAAGALEDADDDEDTGAGAVHQEEWMARVAVLLRANLAASFNQLADLLASKQEALAAAAGAGADPSQLLEQLYWLARMAAHALADTNVGEVPLPPEAVLIAVGENAAHCVHMSETTGAATHRLQQLTPEQQRAAATAGAAAVERLSRALLELTALSLNPAAAPVISPRLLEACVCGVARWADTYLFPEEEEPLPESLQAAFGDASGRNILDMVVTVCQHCLLSFPGEAELHRQVCHSLLPVLVRRKPLTHQLLQLPSWQKLADAFATRQAALSLQLSQKLQRALSRCLCLAASGFAEQGPAQQYVSHLLLQTAKEITGLAGQEQRQLAAAAQRADVQLQVCMMLEVLRGAATAALPSTFEALSALFSGLLSPLLTLHTAFKHIAQVVALLLKLADDIVEALTGYMESQQQKEQLLNWVLQLLAQYRDSNLWQVSLQTAKSLQAERAGEQCRDLRAVLNLLIHITQSDLSGAEDDDGLGHSLASVAPAGATPGPSGKPGAAPAAAAAAPPPAQRDSPISRVVLVGLNIVLPLINAELLKFPKLAQLYYSLLSYMLEVYPQAVADLPPQHFASLMASLEWGLLGSDTVAVHCSLEGLAGLAKFQYQALQTGARGLAGQCAGARSVVSHFQELLLRRLLLEDTPQDLVELSAVALLPLLLSEPSAFAPLSSSIAQAAGAQGDARAAQAVGAALSQLGQGLEAHAAALAGSRDSAASSNSMRAATRQFRQQLCQLVADVRGLIRMR